MLQTMAEAGLDQLLDHNGGHGDHSLRCRISTGPHHPEALGI